MRWSGHYRTWELGGEQDAALVSEDSFEFIEGEIGESDDELPRCKVNETTYEPQKSQLSFIEQDGQQFNLSAKGWAESKRPASWKHLSKNSKYSGDSIHAGSQLHRSSINRKVTGSAMADVAAVKVKLEAMQESTVGLVQQCRNLEDLCAEIAVSLNAERYSSSTISQHASVMAESKMQLDQSDATQQVAAPIAHDLAHLVELQMLAKQMGSSSNNSSASRSARNEVSLAQACTPTPTAGPYASEGDRHQTIRIYPFQEKLRGSGVTIDSGGIDHDTGGTGSFFSFWHPVPPMPEFELPRFGYEAADYFISDPPPPEPPTVTPRRSNVGAWHWM